MFERFSIRDGGIHLKQLRKKYPNNYESLNLTLYASNKLKLNLNQFPNVENVNKIFKKINIIKNKFKNFLIASPQKEKANR